MNASKQTYLSSLVNVHLKLLSTEAFFSPNCNKYRLVAGLRPDPLGELTALPRPPSYIKGCLLPREGRDMEGSKVRGGKGEYASLVLALGCGRLWLYCRDKCIQLCLPSASAGFTTLTLAKRMIKITITKAIANGTCVSFCNAISLRHIIWLPHESHAGMSLPTAVLRVQALFWLPQESLRHILASLGTILGQSL